MSGLEALLASEETEASLREGRVVRYGDMNHFIVIEKKEWYVSCAVHGQWLYHGGMFLLQGMELLARGEVKGVPDGGYLSLVENQAVCVLEPTSPEYLRSGGFFRTGKLVRYDTRRYLVIHKIWNGSGQWLVDGPAFEVTHSRRLVCIGSAWGYPVTWLSEVK